MIISGYEFENPYILRTATFNNVASVYVIYTVINGKTVCLDVGETDALGNRISAHERKDCWMKNAQGGELYVGVMQVKDEFTRRNIESNLRNLLNPTCGNW